MRPYQNPEIIAYSRLLAASFRRWTSSDIASDTVTDALALSLWSAPQAIVSHGTEADPIFRYGNAQALALWEMDWDTFTRLPSRLSAEPATDIQSNRNALLAEALRTGWVDSYAGIRVSSTGRRFEIKNTVLWNVVDDKGVRHGQAAYIRDWRFL